MQPAPVDPVQAGDVVPVVLAALMEDVPHAHVHKDRRDVVDGLGLEGSAVRAIGDVAHDVKDREVRRVGARFALAWLARGGVNLKFTGLTQNLGQL